jgi:two-component system LytT family response regulator
MNEVEQELCAGAFCRIHRSAIVNLERVRRLDVNQEGGTDVVLGNGTRLRLSRRYKKQLQGRLGMGEG